MAPPFLFWDYHVINIVLGTGILIAIVLAWFMLTYWHRAYISSRCGGKILSLRPVYTASVVMISENRQK
jgi:hypothetical protein